jgi:hypothetical protein
VTDYGTGPRRTSGQHTGPEATGALNMPLTRDFKEIVKHITKKTACKGVVIQVE